MGYSHANHQESEVSQYEVPRPRLAYSLSAPPPYLSVVTPRLLLPLVQEYIRAFIKDDVRSFAIATMNVANLISH
jgi:hypothetical protein